MSRCAFCPREAFVTSVPVRLNTAGYFQLSYCSDHIVAYRELERTYSLWIRKCMERLPVSDWMDWYRENLVRVAELEYGLRDLERLDP